MFTDALLAVLHHLAVFTVVAVLVAEWAMLRPGLTQVQLRLVGRLDALYGAMAGVALVIGVLRATLGAKGWAFYAGNPFFWAKVGTFVLVGLASIPPTLAMLKWRRAGLPADHDVARMRVWLNAQLSLVVLLPVFAALMARGVGY
jgi:putative membrane protein